MGIRPQTPFLSGKRFTSKLAVFGSSASAIALSAIALIGCQANLSATVDPAANSTETSAGAAATKSRDTLPSMSDYTTSQTKTAQSESTQASLSARSPISPGQYCFHKAGEKNWLSIRLEVAGDQQLSGESVGIVTHPDQGEVRYEQAFSGQISGSQALVEVTTHIAGVSESRQEAWQIDTAQLDMERVTLEDAPCVEVAANF
jgi:hypothetical protein